MAAVSVKRSIDSACLLTYFTVIRPMLGNPDSGILEVFAFKIYNPGFGIQNSAEESGIPLSNGIWNPSSTNNKSGIHCLGIWNPHYGIQNPRLLNYLTRVDTIVFCILSTFNLTNQYGPSCSNAG